MERKEMKPLLISDYRQARQWRGVRGLECRYIQNNIDLFIDETKGKIWYQSQEQSAMPPKNAHAYDGGLPLETLQTTSLISRPSL
jgi:hypothetical protein